MSGSPRAIPVVHARWRGAAPINIERGLSTIGLLEQADGRERSLFAELESAREELLALRTRLQEMRGEHAQALCVKDSFIERITAEIATERSQFAAERAQFLALHKSERANALAASGQLRDALDQRVKNANDRALTATLRTENLQLLSELAKAAGEASEAKSKVAEHQSTITDLQQSLFTAVRLQLAGQAAELAARQEQCRLREQLLELRSRLPAPGSPSPAPAEPAQERSAVSSPLHHGSSTPFGSDSTLDFTISPPGGGFAAGGTAFHHFSCFPPPSPSPSRTGSRHSSRIVSPASTAQQQRVPQMPSRCPLIPPPSIPCGGTTPRTSGRGPPHGFRQSFRVLSPPEPLRG